MTIIECRSSSNWHEGSDYVKQVADQEDFCNQWKRDVYRFCRSFLGDEKAAEDASYETLVSLSRQVLGLGASSTRPLIIRRALEICMRHAQRDVLSHGEKSRLDTSVLRLPATERAVLVMRNLLRMDWDQTAVAMGVSEEKAHKVWVRGVIGLNEFLHK